jgi:hypothetical protein
MVNVIADRVVELTATTGTGGFTLTGTLPSYRTYASSFSNGDEPYYLALAVDANGNPTGQWEIGQGTFNEILERTTIFNNSNGNTSPVNFSSGTKQVWCTSCTSFFLSNVSSYLYAGTPDQTITGGANVTPYQITATSNFTIDCGKCPAQYWSNNNGAVTITAPSSSGSCYLDIENGSGAGAVTLSGFTKIYWGDSSAGSGTSLSDTTNGHTFRLLITSNRGRAMATVLAGQ